MEFKIKRRESYKIHQGECVGEDIHEGKDPVKKVLLSISGSVMKGELYITSFQSICDGGGGQGGGGGSGSGGGGDQGGGGSVSI